MPAELDAAVLRTLVSEVLSAKLLDIQRNPRYLDEGYHDQEYSYVERGGFFNDLSGRAGEGITKDDVRDVVSALRSIGLRVSFDDTDALLTQYVQAGSAPGMGIRIETALGPISIPINRLAPASSAPAVTVVRGMRIERKQGGVFLVSNVGPGTPCTRRFRASDTAPAEKSAALMGRPLTKCSIGNLVPLQRSASKRSKTPLAASRWRTSCG